MSHLATSLLRVESSACLLTGVFDTMPKEQNVKNLPVFVDYHICELMRNKGDQIIQLKHFENRPLATQQQNAEFPKIL